MRGMRLVAVLLLSWMLLLAACEEESEVKAPPAPPPLVTPYFYVGDDAGMFDAPYPIEHMRRDDGTVRFDRMPNRHANFLGAMYQQQANEVSIGFSRNAAVFFRFDGNIAQDNLPADWAASLEEDCPVFLVNIEAGSAHYGERVPLTAYWQQNEDGYHPRFLLALLPYQGRALEPDELYAAVVLRSLGDSNGQPLATNPAFAAALAGEWPEGEFAAADAPSFAALADFLADVHLAADRISVATAFRTAHPIKPMLALRNANAALDDPDTADIKVIADYPDYYVLEGTFHMPMYQDGSAVYWTEGGRIHFDESGAPILVWWQKVRFSISVPKGKMPADGWPLLFYAAGQGGSYTEIFDRSPSAEVEAGEGPGKLLAQRGIACLGIEAHLTGPRHHLGSTTGYEFYNPLNLAAMSDNVRQGAAEYTYLIKVAERLAIDPTLCPEADSGAADSFFYDPANFFFWGHSTGATIGHLVLAVEPGFRAGLLTGAGASWIESLIYRQDPLPYAEIMKWVLNAHDFNEYHPIMTLFETAIDTSEPANFDPLWTTDPLGGGSPKDVLLVGDYPDAIVSPAMIEGMAVAAGFDLAGDELQPGTVDALETLAGRGQVSLPVAGNLAVGGADYTGVLLQYVASDDGHDLVFTQDALRYQTTCFFANIVNTGQATVPVGNTDVTAACE